LEIIKENNALMNSLEQSRKVANNVLSQLKITKQNTMSTLKSVGKQIIQN
jgi:uncharacterized membrane protein